MNETVDRLRQLDRLFAEKVLGWTPWDFDTHVVPTFTRSLEATWEGALHTLRRWVGPPEMSLMAVKFGGGEAYHATVSNHQASADHPAEALVLACLRAVGEEK